MASIFNVNNYEYECTHKCRFRPHGNSITSALTKRSIPDQKLAAFIAKTCCNYCDNVDDLGRTAVHLCASVERYAILEWLLNKGAIINGRDYESGSSALHRAIYYGCIDCAVLLLRYGASTDLLDEDTRCAFQNVCRFRDFPCNGVVTPCNEILVWGSNKNDNLGIDSEEGVLTPQSLDYFRKENISITAVALGTYHSLFLDRKSRMYAVGHGKGGRLGIGSENSLPAPKKVKVSFKNEGETITCISVSLKHSLLLTNRSLVFACGLNDDQQLGVNEAGAKLTVFKEVVTLRDHKVVNLISVIARDQHSIAYSEKRIYVWGKNNGQWGLDDNVKTIPFPKLLSLPPTASINFVESNNSAIVVYTKDNATLLYFNSKIKSLKPPNYEALKSICVVGGDGTKASKGSITALKLLMLTQTNVIFLWYETTQQFYRCIFSHVRISQIDKIIYKSNQVLILSQGDVYSGKCQQVPVLIKPETSYSVQIWNKCDQRTGISSDYMIRIDLQRFTNVDRAVDIFSNAGFSAFAVLQESPMKYFKLPTLTAEEYSFKKLYHEVSDSDAIHDVVFSIGNETFAAHKFIIYSRSPGLRAIIQEGHSLNRIQLNFDGLTGRMFELMLKYIYTNYLPNGSDLSDIQESVGMVGGGKLVAVCRIFLHFVEKFQLTSLTNYLNSYLSQQPFSLPDLPNKSKYRFNRLRRKDFPELYDVRIVCAGDVELSAHKCILVTRLQYFDMMFSHTWAERTTISLSTVPVEYMEPILDFLYSSDVDQFRKQNFSQTYLYNMIVFCDQFFIERLRKVCEILILDKIKIRKCGDILDFACMYNCTVLQSGCMEFICQNLARVLSYKSLDLCEPDTLKCLNKHYRNIFRDVFDYRMITPDSEAIDEDLLLSFVDDFQVDLDYRMNEEDILMSAKATQLSGETKQSARKYEREAISSMMKYMSLHENENGKATHDERAKSLKDIQVVAEKLQAEAQNWRKVADKKEPKKHLHLEGILQANDLLKSEEKEKNKLVPLIKLKTPEKESTSPPLSESYSPNNAYNINLADVTQTRVRMSQKQRKHLSSTEIAPLTPPIDQTPPTPTLPNAWGTQPQTPTASSTSPSAYAETAATGSAADPTSFANMMRINGGTPSTSAQAKGSFSKIMAEERKQRAYYERMRTKSLALTQIEETAIAELREFYNVDNVADEVITIERKSIPMTMNFSTWQHN